MAKKKAEEQQEEAKPIQEQEQAKPIQEREGGELSAQEEAELLRLETYCLSGPYPNARDMKRLGGLRARPHRKMTVLMCGGRKKSFATITPERQNKCPYCGRLVSIHVEPPVKFGGSI